MVCHEKNDVLGLKLLQEFLRLNVRLGVAGSAQKIKIFIKDLTTSAVWISLTGPNTGLCFLDYFFFSNSFSNYYIFKNTNDNIVLKMRIFKWCILYSLISHFFSFFSYFLIFSQGNWYLEETVKVTFHCCNAGWFLCSRKNPYCIVNIRQYDT